MIEKFARNDGNTSQFRSPRLPPSRHRDDCEAAYSEGPILVLVGAYLVWFDGESVRIDSLHGATILAMR